MRVAFCLGVFGGDLLGDFYYGSLSYYACSLVLLGCYGLSIACLFTLFDSLWWCYLPLVWADSLGVLEIYDLFNCCCLWFCLQLDCCVYV